MLSWIVISTLSFLTLRLILFYGLLNTATLWALHATGAAWLFLVSGIFGYYPDAKTNNWAFSFDYTEVCLQVLSAFLLQVVLATLAAWLGTRLSQGQELIQGEQSAFSKESLANANKIPNSVIIATLLALSAGTIIYAVSIDYHSVWSHYGYRSLSEPEVSGIQNVVATFIHRASSLMGCLAAVVAGVVILKSDRALIVWAMLILSYYVLIAIAFGSRTVSAEFFLIGGVLYIANKRKFWPIVYMIMGFISLFGLLGMRMRGTENVYGVGPFFEAIFSSDYDLVGLPYLAAYTFIDGGFTMAHAFMNAPIDFPFSYKILSFSPTLSFMDGYEDVRELYQQRASYAIPYGAFAEAYLFGPMWFIISSLIVTAAVTCACWLSNVRKDLISIGTSVVCVIALFFTQDYPIRFSFRCFYAVIIMALIEVANRLRARRTAGNRQHQHHRSVAASAQNARLQNSAIALGRQVAGDV